MRLTGQEIMYAASKEIRIDREGFGYDYANKAWLTHGRYISCGHIVVPGTICNCFGSQHEGELISTLAGITIEACI